MARPLWRWFTCKAPERGDSAAEVANDAAGTLAVLAYHKLGFPSSGESATSYYTPQDVFRVHLETLKENRWSVVGIDEVLSALSSPRSLPQRSVLLTFDDGYRSVLELACPVLADFGLPAVVFVPTDYIGRSSRFDAGTSEPAEPVCSLAELRELEAARVSVQSHGASHVKLSTLRPSQVEEELRRSKAALENGLGKTVEAFAYPYGDSGDPTVVASALERSGYRCAFLFGGAPFRFPAVNVYELPRLAIEPDTNLSVELQRVIRSDLRRHLELATTARWRSLAKGQLAAGTLAALDSMLATYVPRASAVIWVESGLQPVRPPRTLLAFPFRPTRSWQLFATAQKGSFIAPWIARGYAYEFRLRAGPDREAVAAVTVVAEPPEYDPAATRFDREPTTGPGAGPYMVASPNPAPAGGTHATTTLFWSTGDNSIGEVEMVAYPIDEGIPDHDSEAIASLERLRADGGDFLLIPAGCLWWLMLYPQLEKRLSRHFRMLADDPLAGRLYDLRK